MKSALDNLIEELENGAWSTQVEGPTPAKEPSALCGSPHCAGCYEVAPGVRIHPPTCSEEYRAWLEHWEAKGRMQ